MLKTYTIAVITGIIANAAIPADTPAEFHFMQINVVDADGKAQNGKFFIGRLPKPGEPIDIVFTGYGPAGTMNFQLRVR